MKVKLNQSDLNSFQLSWLCVEPMLLSVLGKSLEAKLEVYHQLNEGQKALYLFYSFHNHTQTLAEFNWFAAYNINELKSWDGIRKGIRYFNDYQMDNLMQEIEEYIKNSKTDMELNDLYTQYKLVSQGTITIMNNYILKHKDDFLERGD